MLSSLYFKNISSALLCGVVGVAFYLAIPRTYLFGNERRDVRSITAGVSGRGDSEGFSTRNQQAVHVGEKDSTVRDMFFFFIFLGLPCLLVLFWIGRFIQRTHDALLYPSKKELSARDAEYQAYLSAGKERRMGNNRMERGGNSTETLSSSLPGSEGSGNKNNKRGGGDNENEGSSGGGQPRPYHLPDKKNVDEKNRDGDRPRLERQKEWRKRGSPKILSEEEEEDDGEVVTFSMDEVYALSKSLNDEELSPDDLSD